jgi:hypothetical protein
MQFHAVKAGRLHVWLGYTAGGSASAAAPLLAPTDRFDLLLTPAASPSSGPGTARQ